MHKFCLILIILALFFGCSKKEENTLIIKEKSLFGYDNTKYKTGKAKPTKAIKK